jgi:hypothetical protein
MKNKALFWTLTVIVSVLLIYALAATVVLPVFTKNPLPKAVVDQSLSGDEKKADKKGNKKAKSDDVAEEAVALPDSLVASTKKMHSTNCLNYARGNAFCNRGICWPATIRCIWYWI